MKRIILSGLVAILPVSLPAADEKPKAAEPAAAPGAAPAEAAAPAANAQALVEQIEEQLNADSDSTPDDKEFAAAWQKRLAAVDSLIADFRKRFATDPLKWKVSMLEANVRGIRDELSLPVPKGSRTVAEIFSEILNSPDADATAKSEASAARLIALGDDIAAKKLTLEAWDAEYAKHTKAFPTYEDNMMLMEMRLMLVEEHAPTKLVALLEELSKNPVAEVADMAKSRLAAAKMKAELKSKPLDLKFKAIDGADVDLATLRGKVVLIDFWATWCGPCMAELPNVLKTYEKLHAKGFEIIGISLDEDEAELKRVTKARKMTWPQYFDGKGWENVYAKKYSIEGIPAMWLVNKAGMVVDTEATEGLEEKVEKLLKE